MKPPAGPFLCIALTTMTCLAGTACLPKAQPAKVDLPDGRVVEARQVRVWVYELTNQLAGRLERTADEIIESASSPEARRTALEWKAAGVPALQRASFHPDPIVAISDLWLFTIQLQGFFESPEGLLYLGEYAEPAVRTARQMEQDVLDFILERGGKPHETGVYDTIHRYAADHPITHSISTRPTAEPALTDRMPSGSVGAFAAVGTLVEGFADLSDRLSIYGEHMPKQIRWQAELLLFDKGLESIDIEAVEADVARLGRAADHLVEFSDGVPALIEEQVATVLPEIEKAIISVELANLRGAVDDRVAAHLTVALEAVSEELEAALEAVSRERIAALEDAERMANELVDRSFARVESMIDASLVRLLPVGAAVMAGPFVLGLLAGWVLKRPKHRG
jgi:hypothetical protein